MSCKMIRLTGQRSGIIPDVPEINKILRKEVIQPQVPLRLPCYDFTPVIDPAVDAFKGGLRRNRLPWCDGQCVQDPGTYSP